MESNFEKSKKELKDLYSHIELVVKMNPTLYIMPVELCDTIMRRLGHIEDRIKKQTASLMRHIEDKRALNKRIKELEKMLQKLKKENSQS